MSSIFRGSLFRSVAVSVLALAVFGCASPNPTALDKPGDVPEALTAPIADKTAPIWPDAKWWMNFKTDELPALMETAQRENLDIVIANDNVLAAEAQDEAAFAPLLPSVSGNGGATRNNQRGTPVTTNGVSAGLSASYTVDLWGLNQDKLRAARESLRGQRYAAQLTGINTLAAVANAYFNILSLRERITIARRNIDLANGLLAVTEAKVANGVSSQGDLASQQAQVAGQQASLPGLIESEREARYALAILLGRAPEGFDIQGQNLEGIVAPLVQPGLPSEVLLRRADVAQAEATLLANHANVDAARAAFFPSVSLSGGLTYNAANLSSLINPASFAWNLGASLAQTIFDGGAKAASLEQIQAQQDASIASYRKTVFQAFSSVESALGTAKADADQIAALTEQLRADTEALRIGTLEYREGTIDIVALTSFETALFGAENSLATAKLQRLQASVGLYQQLGGGWTQTAADASFHYQLDWWPL